MTKLSQKFIDINSTSNIDLLRFDKIAIKEYVKWIFNTVDDLYTSSIIYPSKENIFNVFKQDWTETKVIILSIDPYFTKETANGYAFSTDQPTTPPSLDIIFEEIERTYNYRRNNNNLIDWAEQDVLLLNISLTVGEGKSMSHDGLGWDAFIRDCLLSLFQYLHSNNKSYPIILAWGNPAKNFINEFKENLIEFDLDTVENSKLAVLEANHPVAQKRNKNVRFVGCNHFNLVNILLEERGDSPINWLGDSYNNSLYHCLYDNISDYQYGEYLKTQLSKIYIEEIII